MKRLFSRRHLQMESLEIRQALTVSSFGGTSTGEGEGETALVQQVGSMVFVIGLDEHANNFGLQLGTETHQLSVDGMQFAYDADEVTQFLIAGGRGNDTADVTGSSLSDRLRVDGTKSQIVSANYKVFVRDIETATWDGGAGTDRARIYDSAGNDVVELRGSQGSLTLPSGNSTSIEGTEKIDAYSRTGNDSVKLFDTPGDDEFIAKPDFSYIITDNTWNYARGFDRVEAVANAGGTDRAEFQGRSGIIDIFTSTEAVTSLQITGDYHNSASGFDRYEAIATDAADSAELFGSSGNDTYAGLATVAELRRGVVAVQAKGFGTVRVVGQGGNDKAYLQGGASGTNNIELEATFTKITGTGFSHRTEGFDANVYGSSGDDQAVFRFAPNEALFLNTRAVMGVGAQRNQVIFEGDNFESFANSTGLAIINPSELPGTLNGSYPVYEPGDDFDELVARFEEKDDLPTIDPVSGDVVFAQMA